MFIEIKELQRKGFSIRRTAKILDISRTTVAKYREMTFDEYMETSESIRKLSNLDEFKALILEWLKDFPRMTSAQVYDWLLEYYDPDISERSVSRYVKALREEFNIPKTAYPRDYEAMDEFPMGHQMQLDFGVKNMPLADRKGHKKVYFMGAVLAHSRHKFGYFQDKPFTTKDLIYAMDLTFDFYGGTTKEIVVDQDSIIVVSENNGDIIYTYDFERYKQQHNLNIWVCRKADPESKGQVENVVKYIKRNFLPHRTYLEPDDLNQSFRAWLERTGNAKKHGTTKKVPAKVFEVEREHLRPILNTENHFCKTSISRTVRKDNTVLYNSNRYSVPLGTYNKHKEVSIVVSDESLKIYNAFGDFIIAEHTISPLKGQLIKHSDHKRDRDTSLDKLQDEVLSLLTGDFDDQWKHYLKQVRTDKGRYFRDQLSLLKQLIKEYDTDVLDEALMYCGINELYSVNDIRNACKYMHQYNLELQETEVFLKPDYAPLNNPMVMSVITQKRNLKEYDLAGGDLYE